METPLMDKRTAFMRVSPESDLIGKDSVKADKNTIVRYNWRESPCVYDAVINHAKENDGKVIIPFDSIVSVRSLNTCTRFVYWRTDDKYIIGELHDSGENYTHGMDDRDGYTAPKEIHSKTASRWVKLKNVKHGEGFPFDGWYTESYRHQAYSRTPLREALDRSHMNLMLVYGNKSLKRKGAKNA